MPHVQEIAFNFSSASVLAFGVVFGLLIALANPELSVHVLAIDCNCQIYICIYVYIVRGKILRFQATRNICDVVGIIVLAAHGLVTENSLVLADF